jgi:hypothetical protein
MANVKSIALGAIVEADFSGTDPTGAPVYSAIGLTTGFTPPGRPGTEADGKILGDTLDVPLPGIEGPAEFTFTQFYTPGDAEVEKVDTAFDNRREPAGASGGVVTIRVLYPHNGTESGDTMPTEAFQVNILNIGPEEVSEPNSTFRRAVQCRRISDITKGSFLVP